MFAEKLLTVQTSSTEAAARASFERSCSACQKTYYSENAYQNHVGSQKHKMRLAALRTAPAPSNAGDTESVMSSTFSLGEPIEGTITPVGQDSEVVAEFSKIIDGIKETSLADKEPDLQRPAHPHPSVAAERRLAHPLSSNHTPSGTPSVEDPLKT